MKNSGKPGSNAGLYRVFVCVGVGGIEHAHRDNTKMDIGGWPLVMTAGVDAG